MKQNDSYIYAHFPSGAITNRVVDALSVLPSHKFTELLHSGKIIVSGKNEDGLYQNLSHHNLRWYLLDDYADACNVNVRYFIYGDTLPAATYYSPFDAEVIPLLNVMPPELLVSASEVVKSAYSNPRFRISSDNTPSAKIAAIALLGGKLPKDVPQESLHLYSSDINTELDHFRKFRAKERIVFHIDYILDFCIYFHLSPHWVFSLKSALLCSTPEADAFFDLFCLLSRFQQISLMAMLVELCPSAYEMLSQETRDRIQSVIAREGGAVSCL